MTEALFIAALFVGVYFLAMTIANVTYLGRSTAGPRVRKGPMVSVIVPARDEECSIAHCLESLLHQDYENYEVIVVDDQSSDSTARIVQSLAADEPRLRLVTASPLPPGWQGKAHALSEGTAVARGEILIFTDADTIHEPGSVSWAVTNLEVHGAAMVSGYLSQTYGSLGERIVVPTMYAAMLVVPLPLIARTESSAMAFAIGQYIAVRREAFLKSGGFEPFKDSVVDDMSMAKSLKDAGFRQVFLDASSAARCHLYDGYRHAFDGIERSIYSAIGGSPVGVAAVVLLVLAVIVMPAASVLDALVSLRTPSATAFASFALFATAWSLVCWDRRAPLVAVLAYPVVFLNLLAILVTSMAKTGFGRGVDWKGRIVRVPHATESDLGEKTTTADATGGPGRWRR